MGELKALFPLDDYFNPGLVIVAIVICCAVLSTMFAVLSYKIIKKGRLHGRVMRVHTTWHNLVFAYLQITFVNLLCVLITYTLIEFSLVTLESI